VDILEKAVKLTTLGGSFGENRKPCHFLALTLKMLQIQPDDNIIEQLIQDKTFKYVRALGAFYLRLTGRPKDIYELLEPLYHDNRKLRVRTITDWELIHMDEYMDRLLHQDIVFQIALPRLPKRAHLEVAGYLDHARQSIMGDAEAAEQYLRELAQKGCEPAQVALEERSKRLAAMSRKYDRSSTKLQLTLTPNAAEERESNIKSTDDDRPPRRERSRSRSPDRDLGANSVIRTSKKHIDDMPIMPTDDTSRTEAVTATREREPKYGSLFKKEKSNRKDSSSSAKRKPSSSSSNKKKRNKECDAAESASNATPTATTAKLEEGSEEYWNAQRAKLGLKQLK
jgi:pre-mRNA-splicing factor 38A